MKKKVFNLLIIYIYSAVKWLIVINHIQNKSFCLWNICVCTVYIYYVYTYIIYLENINMHIYIYNLYYI